MKSLQNFLCCMPLEIGGHVIGWYTILTNILWIIVAYLIMFEDIVDHKIIDKDTSTIIFIFILTFSVTLAIVGYLCIKGTREEPMLQ
ncbi:CLUMA_CG005761, isoform A [Clunio marinus]|uniref:CLUMA_CG005761, isoform A n=1 Tax=Clunio marinus TaxID=568069 RepID=A0A1J1I019_9DIPT|nr:CLUMA_CG005761, isoform A [Clunio marinus]